MGERHRSGRWWWLAAWRRWLVAGGIVAAVAVAGLAIHRASHRDHPAGPETAPPSPAPVATTAPGAAAPSPPLPAPPPAPGPQRAERILPVERFGRYALKLASTRGAALELVDRMAGPLASNGAVGQRDGRIDAFLGPGDYKAVETFAPGTPAPELTLTPFAELNGDRPPRLIEDIAVETDLGDLQQRSYWLHISRRQTIFIEAAGRHLADLRLWKDGTWLVPADPSPDRSEPHPGQPLAVRHLAAELEPGWYRLTAYGGPGVPWTQGGTAKPLILRWGLPRLPATGRRQFVAGPMGLDRWRVPGSATYFRLELPQGAQGTLEVGDLADGLIGAIDSERIDKTSRAPVADLTHPATTGWHVATIRAEAGQPYVLQHFPAHRVYTLDNVADAPYLVAAVHPGLGADDPDLTALLSAHPAGKDDEAETLVARQTIRLAPATPWRRRFTLKEDATLLVEVTEAGRYAVAATGTPADVTLVPDAGADESDAQPARAGGGTWALDAGLYRLTLSPGAAGGGIVTLSLHGEGMPEAERDSPPLPNNAVFAPVTLHPRTVYHLAVTQPSGLLVRKLPADLTDDLPLALPAGGTSTLPVVFPQAGTLQALTEDGRAVAVGLDSHPAQDQPAGAAGTHTVHVANPGPAPLAVSLRFAPDVQPTAASAPPVPSADEIGKGPDLPVLTAGQPRFLDLGTRQSATFAVQVDTPALYRLETTGLLETSGTVRTQVQPDLASATANGVGRNMLLQRYLRQGLYLLTVATQGETRGHLGLSMTTAPIRQGGTLELGIPAHAALGDGAGIAYDFDVATAGPYRLRVLTPAPQPAGDAATAAPLIRLEDGAGWPLTTPDQTGELTRDLFPGHYRLIVQPLPLPSRILALVAAVPPPAPVSGHGPHPLPLNATVANRWEEPAGNAPRQPDLWTFALPAEADATLTLSKGMQADLIAEADQDTPRATFDFRKPWQGRLPAGRYRLEARSDPPNNRLDYRIGLTVAQLVAGTRRAVVAPARVPVALGGDTRFELTSFGPGQVRGTLLDARGQVVAQGEPRADDWSLDIADRLPAGSYTLALDPVGQAQATTELALRVLDEIPEPALAAGQDRQWADGALHSQPLTFAAGDGALIVAAAHSPDGAGLALERRAADGVWKTVASATGPDALLALPRDPAAAAEYRVQAWPLAGSHAPLSLSLRCPSLAAASESTLAAGLTLQPLPGMVPPVGVAAVAPDRPGLFRLSAPAAGLIRGDGGAGRALDRAGDAIAVGSGPLWLVGPMDGEAVRGQRVEPSAAAPVSLTLATGQRIALPLANDGAGPRLWVAQSRVGQPVLGLSAATAQPDPRAAGFDRDGAVVLLPEADDADGHVLRLWRGDGDEAMPVSLARVDFPRPARDTLAWGDSDRALAAGAALDLALPDGAKTLRLALPPRLAAALLDRKGAVQRLLWPQDAPQSYALDSDAHRLLLLNAGDRDGHLSLSVLPAAGGGLPPVLAPGILLRQTQATAGLIEIEANAAAKPMVLALSGPVQDALAIGRDGTVRWGKAGLDIAGETTILLRHGPGPLAVWLADGAAPGWLEAARAATPRTWPAVLPLTGTETAWRFAPGQPTLLHLRTSRPVLAATSRATGQAEQSVWPLGANLQLFLPAGRDTLAGLRPLDATALTGSVQMSASPAQAIGEGLGPKIRLAPGDARLFTFALTAPGTVGIGIKGEADSARLRLFDETGAQKAEGALAMSALAAGRYFLVVENRADADATDLRPVLVGLDKPGTAPPEDIKRKYWDMVTAGEDQ